MKKLIAILLALLMLSSLSVAAFAEATESSDSTTVQLDYVELSKDEYNYDGGVEATVSDVGLKEATVSDVGLKIWLPQYLVDGNQELTEEDDSKGFLLKTQDVQGGPLAFSVATLGTDQVESLEQWVAYLLTHDGYSAVQMINVNGIDAVAYYIPSMDTETISFHMTNNDILEFYFSPFTDEDCHDMIRAMICSIEAAED